MVCVRDPVVQKISQLYEKISKVEDLRPSEEVDGLFRELVQTCIPPHPIDLSKVCTGTQEMRRKLISLCAKAEGLLEHHFSSLLGSLQSPLDHLHLFPYYNNYLNLSRLEYSLLAPHCPRPARLAFLGSGPLPLSSIVLASHHLPSALFHNFDIDASANAAASNLVASHPDLSTRMSFYTADIMEVPPAALREYDVVFLAALVGVDFQEKMHVVEHLAKSMAPGAILMLRSAHGARAFLYPVVDPRHLRVRGFEVLSIFHPTDDVINSVVVARRCPTPVPLMLCNKCAEIQPFNPLCQMNLIEDLSVEEHHCYLPRSH